MKDYIPKHIRERKKKCGWSSPWDNNSTQMKVENKRLWEEWTNR